MIKELGFQTFSLTFFGEKHKQHHPKTQKEKVSKSTSTY